MIETLKDLPDNVAAYAFHGHVTKTDYDTVLIPDAEDRLKRHKKLRFYCEIAPDVKFEPGAQWEDTKFGLGHFFNWERCAVVTDAEWIKHAATFDEHLGFPWFLWPGQYRGFTDAEVGEARKWIAEARR